MANGFGKWGCLLYLFGCVAIFMLFGTKEWMMTYEAKMFNQSVQPDAKRISRRDVDTDRTLLQKYYYDELKKLHYSAADSTILSPSVLPVTHSERVFERDEPLVLSVYHEEDSKKTVMERAPTPQSDIGQVEITAPTSEYIDEVVHAASVEELAPLVAPIGNPPKNSRFIFHNKIPKAGSTTMKWLLVALAKRNGFTLDHVTPLINGVTAEKVKNEEGHFIDGPDGEEALAEYLPKKRQEVGDGNLFFLKHHHWFNFTQFDLEEPTYINVVRDPVTRYASWYAFERYGWARHEGTRQRFSGDEEDKDRSFDECVLGGYKECLEPLQVMVKYFCGTVEACAMMDSDHSSKGNHDWVKVAKATERAKRIIAQQFYVIGVLEHFQTSLKLFEKMLPDYFEGAVEVSQMPEQLRQRASSKSSNSGIQNQTRHMLETGVLRYEVDIYNLVKSLFYEKLKYFNIPLPTK